MSIELKRFYRVLISLLLMVISWFVYTTFVSYLSFGKYLILELLVIGTGMLGHHIKNLVGLERTEEDES